MEKKYFRLPKWLTVLYGVGVVVLVPWTFYLSYSLPKYHLVQHWAFAWAGFNAFMITIMLATFVLALKRSIWLALAASVLATLLVVDAWFDVLSAKPGLQQSTAIALALFIELPIAALTYVQAIRLMSNLDTQLHTMMLKTKKES